MPVDGEVPVVVSDAGGDGVSVVDGGGESPVRVCVENPACTEGAAPSLADEAPLALRTAVYGTMTPCSRRLARNSLDNATSSRTLSSRVSASGARYSMVSKGVAVSMFSVVGWIGVVMEVTFFVGSRPAWAGRFGAFLAETNEGPQGGKREGLGRGVSQ